MPTRSEIISAEAHDLAPSLNSHARKLIAPFNTGLTEEQRNLYGNRLLRLADYLKNIPAKQYNHEVLVSRIEKNTPCGTVACALGHAVASKQFNGLNVKMTVKFADDTTVIGDENDSINSTLEFETINPTDIARFYQNSNHGAYVASIVTAADAYFGPGAWPCIFDGESYFMDDFMVKKATVINRIKKIAKSCYGVTELA